MVSWSCVDVEKVAGGTYTWMNSMVSHVAKMQKVMMAATPPHEVENLFCCLYVRVTFLLYLSNPLKNCYSEDLAGIL